jgi:phage gpG-like protein
MAKKRTSRIGRSKVTFIQRSRSVGAAEKATYHQLDGAGRSRVRRRFLGFTADDEAAILRRVEDGIRRNLGS